MSEPPQLSPAQILRWYADMGVVDPVSEVPTDFATWTGPKKPSARAPKAEVPPPPPPSPQIAGLAPAIPVGEAVALAKDLAASAVTIEALRAAIMGFDGCPLKAGARQTVVDDGITSARLMVLGEAPGKEEDRVGKPFVGRAGQLLDKMLAAIDHARTGEPHQPAYISNSIFWRPPGNRNPKPEEIAICLPFVTRIIELVRPAVLIMVGNTPTQALFPGTPGITRSRGNWLSWTLGDGTAIPAMPMFHPAYLLRQPAQKKLAWADLIEVRKKLA